MALPKSASKRKHLATIKFIHVFLNLVLITAAAAALYFTVRAMTVGPRSELHFAHHYEEVNVDVILAMAVVLAGISFLNLFSLVKPSFNGLLTSFAALLLYLVATLSYAMATILLSDYSERGDLFKRVKKDMFGHPRHTKHVDDLQFALSCCGVTSVGDYADGANEGGQIPNIPRSCCSNQVCDVDTLHTTGCFYRLRLLFTHYGWVILCALLFISIIEIIILVTSFFLVRDIKHSRSKLGDDPVKIPRVKSSDAADAPQVVTEDPKKEEPQQDEKKEDEPKPEEPATEESDAN